MISGPKLRLLVLRVLVLSLLVTLGTRLYFLQVVDKNHLKQTANDQHTRSVVLPAPRGEIVDDEGRPLADNQTDLVIAVDRSTVESQPDEGKAVLRRLSQVVGIPAQQIKRQITPCMKGVPKPCWTGSPAAPVPIQTDASDAAVLRISEHREDFPGVVVDSRAVRKYPEGATFGHETGYVGAVTQDEIDASASEGKTLVDEDQAGRNGLEQSYDSELRGKDGVRDVLVDNRGAVVGTKSTTNPTPGNTLVTSLDSKVQAIANKALRDQIAKSRATYDPKNHKNFAATSGAVVVMDPMTGRIVGLASYPNYDPNEFIGGISQAELNQLTSESAGVPLVSRAVQGQFAPGSTFKLSTASAIVTDGELPLNGLGACPPSLAVGNSQKTNYDSESLPGQISLAQALAFSCDTFFYQFAMNGWYADEHRVDAGQKPVEYLQKMARAYGFGEKPDIDLPDGQQTTGQIVDRAFLKQRWEENKKQYCANAKKGYPDVTDPTRRAYLTQLASENCTDGWRFRIGEAADMAIGQGETTVSPLQLALAYSALVNGGKLYEPTIGRAIVNPQGKVIKQITPKVKRTVPVSGETLKYIRDALAFGNGGVSGEIAFDNYPFAKYPMGGKTGTAEVYGKQDTSWFASWSQNGGQHYVVVGMVTEAGTGATAAAPVVRNVYDGIYGLDKGTPAALPGGKVPAQLPKIQPYGDAFPGGDIVGPDVPAGKQTPTPVALPPVSPQWRPMNRRQRRHG
ncbi:MAG TPA: penicillin-binding protein 2 [Mycobacteriales bacterium]|nr:penicillin-binding protein 2 [Mycobacteriales bacterium]